MKAHREAERHAPAQEARRCDGHWPRARGQHRRDGGLGHGRYDADGGGRARTISAINVTPLVDVVLVLLVILMVASTYIVAQTLKVQLPRAKSTDGTAEKPTKVELLKDGGLRWNEEPVAETAAAGQDEGGGRRPTPR